MTEDFAVMDFALVAVPATRVAEAIESIGLAPAPDAEPEKKGGLLKRLFGGRAAAVPPAVRLTVQPAGSLPNEPLTRMVLTDMGFGSEEDPIRVSAPVGAGGLTLVEVRERAQPGQSDLFQRLSKELAGSEIYSFRVSGARHPGVDCGFAVYLNGAVTRLLASVLADKGDETPNWTHHDKGQRMALEAEALTERSELAISPGGVSELLRALGIDPETMFDGKPRSTVYVLSPKSGGLTVVEAAAQAKAAEEAPQGEGWEDEVTGLLVQAVEDALPEEDQVPWLDKLTAQLEAGDIDGALAAAKELIDKGARAEDMRASDAARLEALFAERGSKA